MGAILEYLKNWSPNFVFRCYNLILVLMVHYGSDSKISSKLITVWAKFGPRAKSSFHLKPNNMQGPRVNTRPKEFSIIGLQLSQKLKDKSSVLYKPPFPHFT